MPKVFWSLMNEMSNFFTLDISDPKFESGHTRHLTIKSPALGHRADISLFVPPTQDKLDEPLPIVF